MSVDEEKKPKAQMTSLRSGLSKPELEHQYKLALMRECQIYGKPLKECKVYFADKGYTLSKTQFTSLRNELKSSKSAKNWFSNQALFFIESDHMISCERTVRMEDDIMKYYWSTDDINIKLRIIAQFESLQLTKTKMFSCTPMVQEMLEAQRRQEDMENKTAEPEKTEERTWESQ